MIRDQRIPQFLIEPVRSRTELRRIEEIGASRGPSQLVEHDRILMGICHFGYVGGHLPPHRTIIGNDRLAFTLLRGNQHYAVGAFYPINGRARRILENTDIVDIGRVEKAHIGNPDPVYDIKRTGIGRVGSQTADLDIRRRTGCTDIRDLDAGDLALQAADGVGRSLFGDLVAFYLTYRTGDIDLALCTITHDDYLVEDLVRWNHLDIENALSADGDVL